MLKLPPKMDGSDGEATASEKLILHWSSAASSEQGGRMLFDGGDRSEAEKYLRAVDEIRRSLTEDDGDGGESRLLSTIQLAMARLEDEFRNILATRSNAVEIESLSADLSFASLSSAHFSCDGVEEDAAEAEEDVDHGGSLRYGETISRSYNSYRLGNSIREIDLVTDDAIEDLRSIAERMANSGYSKECFQAHASARKAALDRNLFQLGVERISIGDVQRMDWELLEGKIRRWIRAAKVCIRVIFPSERRLWDLIFNGIIEDDSRFLETIKGAAIRLLNFAEAISISRRSPEKLFKILDLHDALAELLPDVAFIFLRCRASDSNHSQVTEIVHRLAEAARGILSEFESAVHRDPSQTPVRGGTIHPLTRYVMNYISLISDYKPTLATLIVSRPSEIPDSEGQSPLSSHLVRIIGLLEGNLEGKARLYRDEALYHFFLMNNVHYIVHKVRGNEELGEMIGDDYLRRLTAKYQKSATSYRRSSWAPVLQCLKDEGLQASGSFSSSIFRSALRERFRSFNAAFEQVHRTQSLWTAPDPQLREELRISVSELLIPAYRAFVGRFRHHIESGRHPEAYIKFSVEDLEAALLDFFEGSSHSLHTRRRSHS